MTVSGYKRYSAIPTPHRHLAELNVTPLLDLAFVLLIIFIITTPLMEKTVDLVIPTNKGAEGAVGPSQKETSPSQGCGN